MYMHWAGFIGIFFGCALFALALICGTIVVVVRMRHGGTSAKDRQYQTDEARMIQEIFLGLERMEKRVEALETILMERQGEERDYP